MNKITAFASRNIKEILRNPLSYIFCIGFPIVMLIVMTIVNSSIPPEANMTIFRIDNLSSGIAVFGQMFVMLFTAITVAGDRKEAFLVRMYASPMKSIDFILGYMLPMLVIAVVQCFIIYVSSFIISIIVGVELQITGMIMSLILLIPSSVMFIAFGMLFGTFFDDKSAPGICSIIISLGSFFGGIWFDTDGTGGLMLKICKCMPFYYCTKTSRSAMSLDFGFENFVLPFIVVIACAVLLSAVSSLAFKMKMKADLS